MAGLAPWKWLAALAALAGLVWFAVARYDSALDAAYQRGVKEQAAACTAASQQAATDDAKHINKVETANAAAAAGVDHDLQAKLDDARARYAALLRSKAATHSGGSVATPVPGSADAPGVAAEAAGEVGLPAEDALTATEQAIQLQGWLDFWKAVSEVQAQDQAENADALRQR